MVNQRAINELMVLKRNSFILNGDSFYCSIEFFQFAGDYSMISICLTLNGTYRLRSLYVGIFAPLANLYYLELINRE